MDGGGWAASAEAWIAAQGGDRARRFVLDAPMLARALDVGCGEGRFCRMLAAEGIDAVGVDPVPALLARARALQPGSDHREGRAEALPVEDAVFDLLVSDLTLIDVPELGAAIPETTRALAPEGRFLIANLRGFDTAYPERERLPSGPCVVDRSMEERAAWFERDGIRVRNRHRPLSTDMGLLLGAGLRLDALEEPLPSEAAARGPENAARAARHVRVPWFLVMAWSKPC